MATVCQKDRSDFPIYLMRLSERSCWTGEKRLLKDASKMLISP